MALHLRAVDQGSVAAAAIFQIIPAVFHHNARVRTRYAAIADDQVALGLAADVEWQRLDGHANAVAAGVGDHQGSWLHALRGGRLGLHMVTFGPCGLAAEAVRVPRAVRAAIPLRARAMPDNERNSRPLRYARARSENRNGSRSACATAAAARRKTLPPCRNAGKLRARVPA